MEAGDVFYDEVVARRSTKINPRRKQSSDEENRHGAIKSIAGTNVKRSHIMP